MAKKTKYWIYHIPGVKIGVSQNPDNRVFKQQGFDNYEILEEHTNVKIVSQRERELQIQYGYKVDNILYWKTLRWQKKSQTPKARAKINYKESRAKIDHKVARAKAVAKTDWQKRNQKRDFKASAAKSALKRDYKAIAEKKKKLVNQYDLQGNFIKQWNSVTEAAQELGILRGNIASVCRGIFKTYKNFIWKYAN